MTAIKKFTAAELASYSEAHAIPHRKVVAAMVAESKLLPVTLRDTLRDIAAGDAEEILEHKLLHGEDA